MVIIEEIYTRIMNDYLRKDDRKQEEDKTREDEEKSVQRIY